MNSTISQFEEETETEYSWSDESVSEFKDGCKVVSTVVGFAGLLANLLIILAILMHKKLRKNSIQVYIVTICSVDLIFGSWFSFMIYQVQFDVELVHSSLTIYFYFRTNIEVLSTWKDCGRLD